MTVCRGQDEATAFMNKYTVVGLGATMFEFAGLMYRLSKALSETRPVTRGRSHLNTQKVAPQQTKLTN